MSSDYEAVDHVEVFKDVAGEWRFRAIAGNGEPVSVSEGYVHHLSAVEEASKLWENAEIRTLDSED